MTLGPRSVVPQDSPEEITTPIPPAPRRLVFLEWFRAVAAPIVMYSHVVGVFLAGQHNSPWISRQLNTFVANPLHLAMDFGNVGVVVFFLVSGFIVTHTGMDESLGAFAVKRLLRIYPPLIVAILLSVLIRAVGGTVLETGQSTATSVWSVLSNLTLLNYLLNPQVVLLAVGWTLVIEVLFYLLLAGALPALRRWPGWTMFGELVLVLVLVLTARSFGDSYFLFAVAASYLPALLLGQCIWALWTGRVPSWAGLLLCGGCWGLYVLGDIWQLGRLNTSYNLTLALAAILFAVLLLAEPRLRPHRVVTVLADRSYSLYLLHGVLAFPIMALLYPHVPSVLAVLAGALVTAGGVELSYRYVERPSQRLARQLLARTRNRRKDYADEAAFDAAFSADVGDPADLGRPDARTRD